MKVRLPSVIFSCKKRIDNKILRIKTNNTINILSNFGLPNSSWLNAFRLIGPLPDGVMIPIGNNYTVKLLAFESSWVIHDNRLEINSWLLLHNLIRRSLIWQRVMSCLTRCHQRILHLLPFVLVFNLLHFQFIAYEMIALDFEKVKEWLTFTFIIFIEDLWKNIWGLTGLALQERRSSCSRGWFCLWLVLYKIKHFNNFPWLQRV